MEKTHIYSPLMSKIGTIQGTALIVSIFTLVILLLKIYPDMNNNARETSETIADLEKGLDDANIKLDRIRHQIGTRQHDEEIFRLKNLNIMLEGISSKNSGEASNQAKEIQEKINSLINQLQTGALNPETNKVQY
jgi:hypothetical protein